MTGNKFKCTFSFSVKSKFKKKAGEMKEDVILCNYEGQSNNQVFYVAGEKADIFKSECISQVLKRGEGGSILRTDKFYKNRWQIEFLNYQKEINLIL